MKFLTENGTITYGTLLSDAEFKFYEALEDIVGIYLNTSTRQAIIKLIHNEYSLSLLPVEPSVPSTPIVDENYA